MATIDKHPLDIINEHLLDGYYDKIPPYSYSKDAATVGYLLGYVSKIEYDLIKSKFEFYGSNRQNVCSFVL